jgi:hypothetical protein
MPSCRETCCPEIPDIEVEENTYLINGVAVELTVADTVPPAATRKKITAQAVDADGNPVTGYWKIDFWFIDSPADYNILSPVAPTNPGLVEFSKVTDANGEVEFEVENALLDTWYLCAACAGAVVLSDAITVGT